MMQRITCAANTTDNMIFQQLSDRLQLSGVAVKNVNPSSKYIYFDTVWDDTEIPNTSIPRQSKAGAKPRKLTYDNKPATCGLVWQLRNEGHLSDAEIGLILDTSESTIARRRKKHMTNGSFAKNSTTIF